MAASSEFSSEGWIRNSEPFYACLEAGFIEKCNLETFILSDCVDKIYKGLCQFFYWARKLQVNEDKAVLTFALMGKEGLIRPNVQEIQRKIVAALGPGTIKGINYSENANFVSLIMNSSGAAQTVRQEVSTINGALICYVNTKPLNTYRIRILWSPIGYPLDGIIQSLKPWCENVSLQFEKEVFSNGETIITNKAFGLVTLKEGISLSQLPHVVKLSETFNRYVLVVIRERSPLCLKCRIEGHVRKFCPCFKCYKCNTMHKKNGACTPKTFASIVGSNNLLENNKVQIGHHWSGSLELDNTGVPRNGVPLEVEGGNISKLKAAPASRESDEFSLVTRRVTRSKNQRNIDVKSLSFPSTTKDTKDYNILQDEMDFTVANDNCEGAHETDKEEDITVEVGNQEIVPESVINIESKNECVKDESSILDEIARKRGRMMNREDNIENKKSKKSDIVVHFSGFSINDRTAQVVEFLGSCVFMEIQFLRDDEGERCGEYLVEFASPDLAEEALLLDGKFFRDNKISASLVGMVD